MLRVCLWMVDGFWLLDGMWPCSSAAQCIGRSPCLALPFALLSGQRTIGSTLTPSQAKQRSQRGQLREAKAHS